MLVPKTNDLARIPTIRNVEQLGYRSRWRTKTDTQTGKNASPFFPLRLGCSIHSTAVRQNKKVTENSPAVDVLKDDHEVLVLDVFDYHSTPVL